MNTKEVMSETFLSKRRLGWAGLGAILAGCAVCLGLPLLVTLGVGGGAAAAMASIAKPGAELLVGSVVFVASLGLAVARARSKLRSNERQGCGGTSCSVSSKDLRSAANANSESGPMGPDNAPIFSHQGLADAPIVCTGDLKLAQIQIDGYRAAFAHLLNAERFPGGFRWRFRAELGVASQLLGLVERESACCPFLSYDLARDGEDITWETRADDRATFMLEEYFLLPDRLRQEPRRGHDVTVLKRMAGSAGLDFAAERAER